MNRSFKIINNLSTFIFKAKNNPDFAAAVFVGYGLMVVQTILQIFLVPLYLETFGAFRFGSLMVLISYTGFSYALVGALHTVMLRLFGEAINDRDEARLSSLYVAAKVVAICIGIACGAVIVAVEFVHPILFKDAPIEVRGEIVQALLLSVLHLMLLCELSVEQMMLAAKGRQAAANLITLGGLVVFGITVIPALVLDGQLIDVIACFVVSDIVSRIFATYLSRRYFRARLRHSFQNCRAAMRRILAGQMREYFAFTAVTVVLQADILIVATLGGPLAAAKFVLVWKIAEILTLVLGRVTQHLQAEFVGMDLREEHGRLIRVYREVYGALFGAALCLGVLYGLFGHWVVELWVGADAVPREAWAYGLAGLAILWLSIARLPITLALSLDRINPLLRLAGIELVAKLTVIVLLFPEWGYLAPMIAVTGVHILGIAYGYYSMGRTMLAPLRKATA